MATADASYKLSQHLNSISPRNGVVVLGGYGVRVVVDRGHLLLEDGIGADRRQARLSRVGHGLRRLIIISRDGVISFAALCWLSAQEVPVLFLERDGRTLFVSGPTYPADVRLRRAQARGHETGVALTIAKELISRKLSGQEQLVREGFKDTATADAIAQLREQLQFADNLEIVRQLEARGAASYWARWKNLPIMFPKKDHVPEHWRKFGTRKSPLTGSPRLAINPPGAVLNYCYELLLSETRHAIIRLGMDPGIGVLHADAAHRDSFCCDVMEAVRPSVDAWLFDWITKEPFRRSDFFEREDGNCRLVGPFATKLSQSAPVWGRAIGPVVEWVAGTIWNSMKKKPPRPQGVPTPLTQQRRSEGRGRIYAPRVELAPRPDRICRSCGVSLKKGKQLCTSCHIPVSRSMLIEVAKIGRIATHSPEAEELRAGTQRRQVAARKAWESSGKSAQIDEKTYLTEVQPRLCSLTTSIAIASTLSISTPYASEIRKGRRPHPRNWPALARLLLISNRN